MTELSLAFSSSFCYIKTHKANHGGSICLPALLLALRAAETCFSSQEQC